MVTKVQMPQHVDSLPQLLWWEMDEVAVAIAVIGIGVLLHSILESFVATVFVVRFTSSVKRNSLNGAAFHVLCSTGLLSLNKDFPDLFKRRLFV